MEICQIIHIVAELIIIVALVIFLYYQIRKQDVLIENINKNLEENSTIMKKHDNVIGKIVELMTLKVPPLPPQMDTPQINLQFQSQPPQHPPQHPQQPQQQPPQQPQPQQPPQQFNRVREENMNMNRMNFIIEEPNRQNVKFEKIEEVEEVEEEEEDENIDNELEEELKDLEE